MVLIELFFCEDLRDLDKQLRDLKIFASHDVDDNMKTDQKTKVYCDFIQTLDPTTRECIETCLRNIVDKPKVYPNMVKPLNIIPFDIWIKLLLGNCIKCKKKHRPKIGAVQQALNIAGCLKV